MTMKGSSTMKVRGKNTILLISIFIFIFTLLINQAIYEYTQLFIGSGGEEKIKINITNSHFENGIDIDKVNKIKQLLGNSPITFYTNEERYISSVSKGKQANIFGIGGDFNLFYKLKMKDGIFLKEKYNLNKNKVVVIDDSIAFDLYKTYDVKGKSLFIAGEKFEIIGIVERNLSAVYNLFDEKKASIYIPMEVMKDTFSKHLRIKGVEILGKNHSINSISEVLRNAGVNQEGLIIEDQRIEARRILQREKILVFLVGIFTIFCLIKYLLIIIKNCISIINSQLKANYFLEAIYIRKKDLGIQTLKIIGVVMSIILLFKTISFNLYIDPNKIPQDPTNLKSVLEILRTSITEYLNNEKIYTIPVNESISFYKSLSFNSLLLGLISVIVIIALLMDNEQSIHKLDLWILKIKRVTFYVISSYVISVIVIGLMKLPVKISLMNSLAMYFCLIFISQYPFLTIISQKELETQEV